MKIVFAQGNPEPDYVGTRHNVGFEILDALAKIYDGTWINKPKFNAETSEITINGIKTLLVKPTTYYNETGLSARKLIDFYKLDNSQDLIVVHDDLALPFSTIRIREAGSDAGNNGIKSINAHIGPDYHRIRIGIANDLQPKMANADFVLSKFSNEEKTKLQDSLIPHANELIEKFCTNQLQITTYKK